MQSLKHNFGFMSSNNILVKPQEELKTLCEELCNYYPSEVLSVNLMGQFIPMKNLIKDDLTTDVSMRHFFQIIMQKYRFMESDFTEVYTVLFLVFYISGNCSKC